MSYLIQTIQTIKDRWQGKSRRLLSVLTALVFLLVVFCCAGLDFVQAANIKVDPNNPRYFRDANGQPVFLVGYYDWASIDPNTFIDHPSQYKNMIDQGSQYGLNYIRLSLGINRFTSSTNPPVWAGDPTPTPFLYVNGLADLDQWDDDFWDGLRFHADLARQNGMFLHVAFFDGVDIRAGSEAYRWVGSYWNIDNQIPGGFFGDLDANNNGSADQHGEFYNLSDFQNNTGVGFYQRKLIDKAISETSGFGNVFYEVGNELISAREPWIEAVVDYVRTKTPKAITWNGANDDKGLTTKNDGYARHDGNSPQSVRNLVSPARVSGGNPFWIDPDGSSLMVGSADDLREAAWYSFTRGAAGWGGFTKDFWRCGSSTCFDKDMREKASYYGYLLDFIQTTNFVQLQPRDDLISGNSNAAALALPGQEYIVYLRSGGSVTVDLSAASGQLTARWFNPKDGTFDQSFTVSGGSSQTINKPGIGDKVLYITSSTSFSCDDDGACEPGENSFNCPNDCYCGNPTIDPGEQCEGTNLNNQTCELQGFPGGGTLSCNNSTCQFDFSGCIGGVCDNDDQCELSQGENSSNCSNDCYCGDGVCEPGENCPADCGGGPGSAITCTDISSTNVNSSNSYQCNVLDEGSQYYTDRTYTLLTVPNELQGTAWIKTPNNDKNRTDGEGFLTVTPFKDVTVYVAYDSRGTPPNWLSSSNGWTSTGQQVTVTDAALSLNLYQRSYSANQQISLGGNNAAGVVMPAGGGSNYVVAILGSGPPPPNQSPLKPTLRLAGTPPPCQCFWIDQTCGGSGGNVSCSVDQMLQRYSCTPVGCIPDPNDPNDDGDYQCVTSPSQCPIGGPLFTFLAIADTQLGSFGMWEEGMQHFVDQIRTEADFPLPDFILISGDLTDKADQATAQELKNYLDQIGTPYYAVAGNHDAGYASEPSWFESLFIPNGVTRGPGISYSFDSNGYRFLMLSRYNTPRPSPYYDQLIPWITEQVNSSPGPVFMADHYPLREPRTAGKAGPNSGFQAKLWDSFPINDFDPNKFIGFLSGHTHINSLLQKDGIYHIGTGALATLYNSYRLFSVYSDRIDVETYRLVTSHCQLGWCWGGFQWTGSEGIDPLHQTNEDYNWGLDSERNFTIPLN